MNSWASILQQVGTPLQLAALFLLLAAWLARSLVKAGRWKPSNAIARLIIDRVFAGAIVAVVLGTAASLLAPVLARLGSDQEFRGVVLSTTGEHIPFATVDVFPLGQWTTNGLGQFTATIPRSQTQKEYKLQITAPNYEQVELSKSNADLAAGVEIRLKPAPPPELIKELDPTLLVGQVYGMPFVVPNLRIRNNEQATAWISEVSATLAGDGSSFTLQPMTWTINSPFSGFFPITGNIPLPVAVDLDLRVAMISTANYSGLQGRINALPEYRSQRPCVFKTDGSTDPLSEDAYQLLSDYARNHFAWKPGDWRFQMTVKWGQQVRTFDRAFTLSASEVERLRASIPLARQCMGVSWQYPLAQDGDLANFLSK
jgi:hypothetical protein